MPSLWWPRRAVPSIYDHPSQLAHFQLPFFPVPTNYIYDHINIIVLSLLPTCQYGTCAHSVASHSKS